MTQDLWNTVEDYLTALVVDDDPALDAALAASDAADLPQIEVAPTHGKLLHLLARIQGARSILEIGTLGGYSTIWLAKALPPDGRLITLEAQERHAEIARANLARAGVDDRVEVRLGAALDSLAVLDHQNAGPFDLVFIDADKPNNPRYFEWALKLTRPGSVIIVDNVVRGGHVADSESSDPAIIGTRTLGQLVADEPRVSATMVQTVSSKGYDGFALIRVND